MYPPRSLPFTAPQHDSGEAAFDQAHNYEFGRQHNGYSHMGIPPECPACLAAAAVPPAAGDPR